MGDVLPRGQRDFRAAPPHDTPVLDARPASWGLFLSVLRQNSVPMGPSSQSFAEGIAAELIFRDKNC